MKMDDISTLIVVILGIIGLIMAFTVGLPSQYLIGG
jgi:predicted membrane protein